MLALGLTGPTLAIKVRAACAQLGIATSDLTVPAALRACNEAIGKEASGPLLAHADELVDQLGLSFSMPVPQPPRPPAPLRQQRGWMPKMVVFDLDFTLWKPELYQLSSGPPFKTSSDGCVVTCRGERLELFPAARMALGELADAGVPIAIASRASEVAWAQEIIRLMRVDEQRTMADVIGSAPVVIQAGSKVKHLKYIASKSGVPLREMLFFDNERNNIQEVEKVGPTCMYCPRGMTDRVFREGVAVHAHNRVSTNNGICGRRHGGRDGNNYELEAASQVGRRKNKKDRGRAGHRRR